MIRWIVASTPEELGRKAAAIVYETVRSPRAVLALPTGRTPLPLYARMIEDHRRGIVTFHHVITFNLDEYVGVPPDDPASFYSFMQQNFFSRVDIPAHHTFIPNGMAEDLDAECRRYDRLINLWGPWDLAVLGVGRNGHIGFNEPGDDWSRRTHVVTLSASTRAANADAFMGRDVPDRAITVGIASILESRHILLLIAGQEKTAAAEALLRGRPDVRWPVTSLLEHPQVTVIVHQSVIPQHFRP